MSTQEETTPADPTAGPTNFTHKAVLAMGGLLAVVIAGGWIEANGSSYQSLYNELFGNSTPTCQASQQNSSGTCPGSWSGSGCCPGSYPASESLDAETLAWALRPPVEAPRPTAAVALMETL